MHCPCRLEATRFVDPLSNQVCWLHNSSFASEHVHACNAGEVVGPNDGFITKFVRQRLEGEKLSRTRALCKDRPGLLISTCVYNFDVCKSSMV